MFGRKSSPKSEAGTDDSSSTTMSKRSELNEGNDDIRYVFYAYYFLFPIFCNIIETIKTIWFKVIDCLVVTYKITQ